jgi:hypothetical protein
MEIYPRKLLLVILCIGNISYANAQLDSNFIDSQKVTPLKPHFFRKMIIPIVLLGYGALSLGSSDLRQLDRYINNSTIGQHGYSGSADDYLRYGPIAAVYGLDLIGIESKNKFVDRSLMLAMSMALTSTAVTFTKHNIHRERPDGSSFTSFPSSHTSMAFMAAEFMNQEYGEKSAWFSIVGYGTATATGILRLYHHVHWFSDVVMGAGYGILSTKLVYFIYPYLKRTFVPKNNINFALAPSFQDSHLGFSMSLKFR